MCMVKLWQRIDWWHLNFMWLLSYEVSGVLSFSILLLADIIWYDWCFFRVECQSSVRKIISRRIVPNTRTQCGLKKLLRRKSFFLEVMYSTFPRASRCRNNRNRPDSSNSPIRFVLFVRHNPFRIRGFHLGNEQSTPCTCELFVWLFRSHSFQVERCYILVEWAIDSTEDWALFFTWRCSCGGEYV